MAQRFIIKAALSGVGIINGQLPNNSHEQALIQAGQASKESGVAAVIIIDPETKTVEIFKGSIGEFEADLNREFPGWKMKS